jgi:lipid-A-disaccharide synthase
MKYYLIAGEASGDLHGSNLMKGIREADKNANFRYFGGDLMQNQGGTLVKHYREMAFMGVVKVLLNLSTIGRNLSLCRSDILEFQPDVIILIDFPGFNIRIAKYAKKKGFKVFYYISPKVWAWNKGRIKTIRETISKMFVILPFEVEFYRNYDFNAEYHGNPILDAIQEKMDEKGKTPELTPEGIYLGKPVIALLPGSRKQEIHYCLPEMLAVISHFPEYQFIIAGAPGIDPSLYKTYIKGHNASIVYNQTYDLLKRASAAVVTSGTATLETALMMVPEVVCYKMGSFTYNVGKHFVHIRFFSLVNLIMGKEVVKELLQSDISRNIIEELKRILFDNNYRQAMLDNYVDLRNILGSPGASGRVGRRVVDLLEESRDKKSGE